MKLAIPIWQGRVSPVFDVAGLLLVVNVTDGQVVARQEHILDATAPDERLRKLVELGVETLICGAVSQPFEMMMADRGIRVIARICGDVEDVLAAFLAGRLGEECFVMPGCCGRRRQFRGQMRGQQGGQRRCRRGRRENP